MIFERENRQSRENSAVKYNPYKGRKKNMSLGNSDYNILNLKTDKREKKKNKGIFEKRRLNSAKRRGDSSRRKGVASKGSSRRDTERRVSKSKDTKRAQLKGTSGMDRGSEFFSSISSYQTNAFLGFKRKPSLDVQKLAEEKAQQNVFGRKSSMIVATGNPAVLFF